MKEIELEELKRLLAVYQQKTKQLAPRFTYNTFAILDENGETIIHLNNTSDIPKEARDLQYSLYQLYVRLVKETEEKIENLTKSLVVSN